MDLVLGLVFLSLLGSVAYQRAVVQGIDRFLEGLLTGTQVSQHDSFGLEVACQNHGKLGTTEGNVPVLASCCLLAQAANGFLDS